MPDATIPCPYCNALVPIPPIPPESGRLLCPRCGDSFPLTNAAPAAAASTIDAEVQRHRRARQASGLRSVKGTLILGLCLGLLGVGVGIGIVYYQRSKQTDQPHANVETARPVAPAEMPGLGYLPEGTDSAIAIQLRPLIDALPDGKGKDARTVLQSLGVPGEVLAGLDRAVGVGLDNIDQVVLGLKLKDGSLFNQVVLVVHTRQNFSITAIADKAKANPFKKGERTFYRVTGSQQLQAEVYWWAPNDRVLVAAFDTEQLEKIPTERREGIGHLAPSLSGMVSKQLAADTYLWAVLDSEKWDTLSLFVLTFGSKRTDVESLSDAMSKLRTAVLAVRIENEPSVTVWFDLKAEASATELREWLTAKFQKDSGRVTVGGAGNRVLVQTAAAGIRGAVEKVLSSKK